MHIFNDHRLRQREYLLQISRAMTAQLDLVSVLSLVISYAVEMTAGTSGLIALYDEESGDQLRIRASAHVPRQDWPAFVRLLRLAPSDLAQQGEKVLREVADDIGLPLRQMIALPLTLRTTPVGLIYVFRAALNVAFSADDRQVLEDFADQAAIAVSNARLYQGVLREKQRLDATIEHSADGVMIIDQRWRITTFNRTMELLTGWSREEAVGRPCAEVLGIHNLQGINICLNDCPLQRMPATHNPVVEGQIRTRDGRELYVQSRYAPQRGPQGQFLGAIANVRDITLQKQEEELQNTFISVISHELKTPVSIIKGFAGTLQREDATFSAEQYREGLHLIEEEADRLARLIQDLLDVSRLTAGGIRLDVADVALAPLVADVVRSLAPMLTAHYQVELRFPDDLPPVRGDYERCRQVITNLVSNAIKYSPEGGMIRIGGWPEAGYAVCYVSDQGIGIANEEHEAIFRRFYRVDNRLRRETQGSGLGLFLTRAIIEAHGGRIWVESQLGKGARFVFTLPLGQHKLAE
ncbi:ATP-binding protein [Candidatus Viridilinea mediisalina]|uniref:histidine kinase n=1 Tax=Candidatus Viridilinea mediisalina TaxID=2024553 RepID=A0A2A6RGR1_9CHLR|nr:ATP-binding protein [Candidatus Viridilinea mediisalina]PDW02068.1 histidine kinase [Candidatus Viridilinea mediisalina]